MHVRYKYLTLVTAVVLSVLSMLLLMRLLAQPEVQKTALSDAEAAQALAVDPGTLPIPDEVSSTGTGVSAGTQVINFGPGASGNCSLGPVLSRSVALIAGHCFDEGEQLFTKGLKHLGEVSAVLYGDGYDVAVVTLDVENRGDEIRVTPVTFDSPGPGDVVAKFGQTTSLTAGLVLNQETSVDLGGGGITTAKTTMCVRPGDSGAAVFDSSGATWGIVSGYAYSGPSDAAAPDGCDGVDNFGYVAPLKDSVEALTAAGVDLGEPEDLVG